MWLALAGIFFLGAIPGSPLRLATRQGTAKEPVHAAEGGPSVRETARSSAPIGDSTIRLHGVTYRAVRKNIEDITPEDLVLAKNPDTGELAAKLGIDLDGLTVAQGVVRAEIGIAWSLDAKGISHLKGLVRGAGAKTLIVEFGPVVNQKLARFLMERAMDGRPFHGGVVRLIEVIGDTPYFEIVFPQL